MAAKPPLTVPHFGSIPVYKDPAAPLDRAVRDEDGKPTGERVEVDYTIFQAPGREVCILVHPDKWDDFREALKMLNERRKDMN